MVFNFASIKEQGPRTRLSANAIHDVTLKEVTMSEGKKQDGNTWHSIDITFINKDGLIYTERVFEITEQDDQRRKTALANGQEIENPSQGERKLATLAMVGMTLVPESWDKFVAATTGFQYPKDFVKMGQLFIKVMAKGLNKPTKLKLVANSQGYASLPYFVNLRGEEVVITNKWLGENVTFTPSEIRRMETAKPAPTKMEEFAPAVVEESKGSEDSFDLESLEF